MLWFKITIYAALPIPELKLLKAMLPVPLTSNVVASANLIVPCVAVSEPLLLVKALVP